MHSLVATFSEARKAIESLGRAGIEAEEMSAGSRSLKDAGTDPDTRQRDVAAAIACAAVGGVIGGVRKLPLTQEWELTYDEDAAEPDGTFRVAVGTADAEDMEKARRVLESEHPQDLKTLDS